MWNPCSEKHPESTSKTSPWGVSGGPPAHAGGQGWRTRYLCTCLRSQYCILFRPPSGGEQYLRKRGRKRDENKGRGREPGATEPAPNWFGFSHRRVDPGASAAPHGSGQWLSSFGSCDQFKLRLKQQQQEAGISEWAEWRNLLLLSWRQTTAHWLVPILKIDGRMLWDLSSVETEDPIGIRGGGSYLKAPSADKQQKNVCQWNAVLNRISF